MSTYLTEYDEADAFALMDVSCGATSDDEIERLFRKYIGDPDVELYLCAPEDRPFEMARMLDGVAREYYDEVMPDMLRDDEGK